MMQKSSHGRRLTFRRISGILLVAIYLVIALAPLASVALHSKVVAHAVTGECVGDCDICGCSLEARANHTCCCAKKHQMLQSRLVAGTKSCCPLRAAAITTSESAARKPTCCARKKSEHVHDDREASEQDMEHQKVTVFKCGYPCGKGKLLALNGISTTELIPISTSESIVLPYAVTLYSNLTQRLASRHGEPPDPPPKLSVS